MICDQSFVIPQLTLPLAGAGFLNATDFASRSAMQEKGGPDAQLIQQVSAALSTWGFFQLINHGIDEHFLDKHLAATKRYAVATAAIGICFLQQEMYSTDPDRRALL